MQDAFEKAARLWPSEGVPASPGAWITTVARNTALDRIRRAANERRKVEEVGAMDELRGGIVRPGCRRPGRSHLG